jgi:predicted FMN-binding regulatory protein PaiB
MIIDRMEATAKLSQNRTDSERRNIISQLSNSPHAYEQSLSAWIKEALEKSS